MLKPLHFKSLTFSSISPWKANLVEKELPEIQKPCFSVSTLKHRYDPSHSQPKNKVSNDKPPKSDQHTSLQSEGGLLLPGRGAHGCLYSRSPNVSSLELAEPQCPLMAQATKPLDSWFWVPKRWQVWVPEWHTANPSFISYVGHFESNLYQRQEKNNQKSSFSNICNHPDHCESPTPENACPVPFP